MDNKSLWTRYQDRLCIDPKTGFMLDTSRMKYSPEFLAKMEPKIQEAYSVMAALEKGEIANPDEKRMVGHYWLRDSKLSPTREIQSAIDSTLAKVKEFAAKIHSQKKFESLLLVGIGGSALGPQFANQALSSSKNPMKIFFFDNTDPDGMAKALDSIPDITKTLVVIVSKSGGTKETRNGQLVAKEALTKAGVAFNEHFVAVTSDGSELDKIAIAEKWFARFPMWDWVGGRTSELSAVGLLPIALQGFDADAILTGARDMDALTRRTTTVQNPAALMALSWYHAGSGKGTKDMVVLPYKDRLELFSRYLQQLVMESLGKEHDLSGKVVNQGIAVYGNKGSTDQHAYVQQLRDGVHNFFAVFIEVLKDDSGIVPQKNFSPSTHYVEPEVTSGDYLLGFFLGTRKALFEKDRESVTITVKEVSEYTVGMLIALFERAVGFYAHLVNINAYHQPGVEAGKKAASEVLSLQLSLLEALQGLKNSPATLDQIIAKLGRPEEAEHAFKILRHLACNGRVRVTPGKTIFEDLYQI